MIAYPRQKRWDLIFQKIVDSFRISCGLVRSVCTLSRETSLQVALITRKWCLGPSGKYQGKFRNEGINIKIVNTLADSRLGT